MGEFAEEQVRGGDDSRGEVEPCHGRDRSRLLYQSGGGLAGCRKHTPHHAARTQVADFFSSPLGSLRRTPHRYMFEAGSCDAFGIMDVSEIKQDRNPHDRLQLLKIQVSKHIPLGHNYQCIGSFGCMVGVSARLEFR